MGPRGPHPSGRPLINDLKYESIGFIKPSYRARTQARKGVVYCHADGWCFTRHHGDAWKGCGHMLSGRSIKFDRRCPIIIYIISGWPSKNRGILPPKWMVKIMENPIKMDDLEVPLFLETPIYVCENTPEL